MNVIMLTSFKSVGKSGDIVDVKPGYAKNYLIPFGIAKYATKFELSKIEEEKAAIQKIDEKNKEDSQKLKKELESDYVVIVRSAGDDGRLYGSVRTIDVIEAIDSKIQAFGGNLKINRGDVDMGYGIKEVGIHNCKIYLYSDIFAIVKLNIARSVSDAVAMEKAIAEGKDISSSSNPISSVLNNVNFDIQSKRDTSHRVVSGSSEVADADQDENVKTEDQDQPTEQSQESNDSNTPEQESVN